MENNNALEKVSTKSFNAYLEYRNQSYALLEKLLALEPASKVQTLAEDLSVQYPQSADDIADIAEYMVQLINALEVDLKRRHDVTEYNDRILRDKFCVIGRVDTGTTDYGANPFYGKYVNVGTHGVLLDTILSETFIVPVSVWFNILFMLIFIPLFFLASARFPPVLRYLLSPPLSPCFVLRVSIGGRRGSSSPCSAR